ncbi:BMP family lipoprotein [Mycoplasmopsis edwardii]|nr:BMP family ABC transporter substrate-binding protein [Mycoplasmopsis edwardii]
MKFNKKLISLFMGTTLTSLPMVIVSCGKQERQEINNFVPLNERITEVVKNPNLSYEALKENAGIKIALINGSGGTLDKSFNQSSWEALIKLVEDTRKDDKNQIEITDINPGTTELTEVYNNALESGQKVWILSGWNHGSKINAYLENPSNVDKLIKNNVTIIALDFTVGLKNKTKFKNLFEVNFKIQEAAYIVGNALANAFGNVYPGNNNTDNRKFGAYGGGNGPDVVSFITGYLKGVQKYNSRSETTNKINHIPNVALNAGYSVEDTNMSGVTLSLVSKSPKFVYPVVAGGVSLMLDEIRKRNMDTYVVGVDVDQSKSYPAHAGRFATSVQKNIAQAIYDVINEFVFGIKNKNLQSRIVESTTGAKSLLGGFAEGWVGYAKSTVSNEKLKDAINRELEKSKNKFIALSEDEKRFINAFTDYDNVEYNENLDELVNKLVEKINS